MANADPAVLTRPEVAVKEPPLFRVVYLNDNTTTVEFVIETLIDYFNYTAETAIYITQDIHEKGSAVVAVLPFEIAEQRGIEVTLAARTQNYPLQVKIEPDA